eukprot:c19942_g1_i1 orf=136-306(+)
MRPTSLLKCLPSPITFLYITIGENPFYMMMSLLWHARKLSQQPIKNPKWPVHSENK